MIMKSVLKKAFVVILTLSTVAISSLAILTFNVNASTVLPTAEKLLEGFNYYPLPESFKNPVITAIDMVETPITHLRVRGNFGTDDSQFSIHLPPKDIWEERFFQMVHPTELTYDVIDAINEFHFESGGYTVQTSSMSGYLNDSAAAHLSRTIALNYYDFDGHIFGYIYGGSGGSYQLLGAIESEYNIYDGSVPFIPATPSSFGTWLIRDFARIVLEDVAPQISDAVSPGGSGDPFTQAGLNDLQRSVLEEVTKLGVPLRAWEFYENLLMIDENDPAYPLQMEMLNITRMAALEGNYVEDFWTKDGFTGTEKSELGELFRSLRDKGTFTEDILAASAIHRHLVPNIVGLYSWDNLMKLDGTPMYNQRTGIHFAQIIADQISGGANFDGDFYGKSIMVVNLLDVDTVPWHGDWHMQRVREAKGPEYDNYFRLWYIDNAHHPWELTDENYYNVSHPHIIQYAGVVQQALRDLSAWVEKGIEPPKSTEYSIEMGSQIILEDSAQLRHGIQPTVDLLVNGYQLANISLGNRVDLKAIIQTPINAGEIVRIEWDIYGDGNFKEGVFTTQQDGTVIAETSHLYEDLGTYIPQIRVTAHRDGNSDTHIANIQNLGRARVVVN